MKIKLEFYRVNNFIKGEWKMSNLVIKKYDCQKCVKDNWCDYKKYQDKFESNVEEQFRDKNEVMFEISCKFYEEA